MGSELIPRWLSGARSVERQRRDHLARIEHRGDEAGAWIAEIGRATRRSDDELLQTDLYRQHVVQLAPGASELFAMFELTQAMACARVINDLYRPGDLR